MEASFYMKAIRTMLFSLVGTLLITRSILGYSTGARTDSCNSLTVDHVDDNGIPIPASTSPSPFTVRILSRDAVYRENRAVKVVIDVPVGTQFTGFVLQARETVTSTPVGRWESSLADGTKTVICTSENDTITHSSNIAVTSRLELQWTPTQDYGQVEFRASIAQDFNVFWNNVRSQPITFDSRAVFYVNQTEITLTEGRTQYVAFCVNRLILPVRVDLTLTGDSAETADLIRVPTNLELPMGASTLCWPVGLLPKVDNDQETQEILFLSISSVGGAATIDDTAASVKITILDNDVSVMIGFRERNLQVSEAEGRALIEVCASTTLREATSVGFTVERLRDSTSAVDQDLKFSSPVTFSSGQNCSSIRIDIVQDNLNETIEVFVVKLTPLESTSYITISGVPMVLAVINSAPGEVGISITSQPLDLPENSSVQVQVCASRPVDENLTIDFNIIRILPGDPATDDITFSSPLIILSGTTCNFIDIFVQPDNVVEDTETFLLTLTSSAPFGVLRQSSQTITVTDSEEMFLPVSISPSSLQVQEGKNFTLTICYSGVQTTTAVSLSTTFETADEQDLAANFPMETFTVQVNSNQECTTLNGNVVEDNEIEEEETFLVTILSVSTDSSMRLDERQTTATVTILERDDPCFPNNPCQNNGVCSIVMTGDVEESVCMCTNAWTGANCENAVVCLSDPCQNGANCEAVQDGSDYQCTNCPMMYEGKNCDIFLPCSSDPCRNGGTCTNLGEIDFECSCLQQYAGKDCTFDNPCLSNPCDNGDCEARDDGQFECVCNSGFFGVFCERTEACIQLPCQNGGSCVSSQNDPSEFECMCRRGFRGFRCQNVDFCFDEPCLNGGTCTHQGNSFTCTCRNGFSGDKCNIAMVTFNPGGCFNGPCRNGGTCIESTNNFTCNCPRGWTGKICNFRQICAPEEDLECQNGGTCWQTVRGEACECPPGFNGFRCELDITSQEGGDFCTPNPCQNGGRCFQPDDGNFVCTCVSDLFSGARCQNCVCKNGGTCVTDRCVCPQGTTGERCEILEACINFNCNNGGTCFVENDIPMCDCQDGFLGSSCDITDRCFDVTCLNGGTCQQTDGKCLCLRRFGGDDCSIPDRCFDVTCLNGGTCRQADGNCLCPTGFGGEDCSVPQLSQTGSESASPVLQGSLFCLLLCSIMTLFLT